jgi:ATP-dependent Clp protease ATP-binding subunit ClpA
MLDRFTPPARQAVAVARAAAEEVGEPEAAVHHLLVGLLSVPSSGAGRALGENSVTTRLLLGGNDYVVLSVVSPEPPGSLPSKPLAEETEDALRGALELADELGHSLVGTEHVLVAVLERPTTRGARQLRMSGMSADAVRARFFGA